MVDDVIDAFGLCRIGHVGWEADDVIATVVEQALSRDIDVTVVSPDKDIRQLLAPRVRIYHARKDLFFTEVELLTDWGVRPDQVIDFQSLVGDAVDNVPGVPQIGPKTATALLQQFGTREPQGVSGPGAPQQDAGHAPS
jgi:DNA polymerase-1